MPDHQVFTSRLPALASHFSHSAAEDRDLLRPSAFAQAEVSADMFARSCLWEPVAVDDHSITSRLLPLMDVLDADEFPRDLSEWRHQLLELGVALPVNWMHMVLRDQGVEIQIRQIRFKADELLATRLSTCTLDEAVDIAWRLESIIETKAKIQVRNQAGLEMNPANFALHRNQLFYLDCFPAFVNRERSATYLNYVHGDGNGGKVDESLVDDLHNPEAMRNNLNFHLGHLRPALQSGQV